MNTPDVSTWQPLEPSYYTPDHYVLIDGIKCTTLGKHPYRFQNVAQWYEHVMKIRSEEQLRAAWVMLLTGWQGYRNGHCFLPTSQDYQVAKDVLRVKGQTDEERGGNDLYREMSYDKERYYQTGTAMPVWSKCPRFGGKPQRRYSTVSA